MEFIKGPALFRTEIVELRRYIIKGDVGFLDFQEMCIEELGICDNPAQLARELMLEVTFRLTYHWEDFRDTM